MIDAIQVSDSGCTKQSVISKPFFWVPTMAAAPNSSPTSTASWTFDRMAGDYGSRLEALVKRNNPGWKPGNAFDTSILDQLDGMLGGVDFRA